MPKEDNIKKLEELIDLASASQEEGNLAKSKFGYKVFRQFKSLLNRIKIEKIDLNFFNFSLLVIAIILTIIFGYLFYQNQVYPLVFNPPEIFSNQKLISSDLSSEIGTNLPSRSGFVEAIKKRNIFLIKGAEQGPAGNETTQQTKPEDTKDLAETYIQDTIKDLKIRGIIQQAEPYVVIEDTKEQKSNFLHVGQKIRELEIMMILKDRIIVSYNNKKAEIRMEKTL
ncbi:MAG: hypothetical protein V1872_10385 [bacterium]